jgi:hypothetical protein
LEVAVNDFRFQILVWGYAVGGPDVANDLAWVCEQGTSPPCGHPWWDRTAADLAGQLISHGGGPYERVPDHWALPGVTELRMLQEVRP